ncbi:MAG: AIR synthase-related protein [Patescibacteria group bacterium]
MYNPTKPYKHQILKLIESTWHTPYVKVERGVYPVFRKRFSLPEVQHTDGIGTKGIYHWRKRTFKSAVLDVLAMNLNDLAMMGATPYALQNHIVLPKDDHDAVLNIVKALARECRKRRIAMTGGETSIHDDVSGLDIGITVSGFIGHLRQNKCRIGDVLIGLKSNGLHSNGFTKVREVLRGQYKKDFTIPTAIYLDEVLPLLHKYQINGMMHVTGGAFTKLKDILGRADAAIRHPQKLRPQKVFQEIYKRGVSNKVMYSTFNCGIGFIVSVPRREVSKILSHLKNAAVVGEVVPGGGRVEIHSAFDGKLLKL